ncbi:MAG: Holliday junction resolvase RuvX [Halobacteriovorax sp.]|nr:Holliday junction resolvase RuvX [Halobacteriovorax sp.]|tara:strand:+ start:35944 stop:36471 length:528 start_codon:yes stop_codon:yes gene_type:complete
MSIKTRRITVVDMEFTRYLIKIMKTPHPKNIERFKGKHLLSIDYGTKVVGLASYAVGRDPYPLCFGRIIYRNDDQVIKELMAHIDENAFDILILGLPLYTDGTESDMTKTVRNFGEKLKEKAQIELFLQDETLSSFEAEDRMKNSPQYNFKVDLKKIDELAASIILEDFLASNQN